MMDIQLLSETELDQRADVALRLELWSSQVDTGRWGTRSDERDEEAS